MSSEMSRDVDCHDVMIFRHDPLLPSPLSSAQVCLYFA